MAVMGLGIDVVDVDRAEAMLAPRRRRVLDRLLTADELAYVMKLPHPARHLAVRLAAKEAVYKALQVLPGSRPIGWRDIEVVRGEHGRPSVRFHGLAKELVERAGGLSIHLSLTHSDRSAVAAAILES
jgi:phosphopantetheine--protein transferase-like protein